MLAREHRYPFFQGVPEQTYSTRYFTLRYRVRHDEHLRVAFVAGKKVHKHSVVRNRVKRIFSETLTDIVTEWNKPYDLVFYLRVACVDATGEDIQTAMRQSLLKIGVVQ